RIGGPKISAAPRYCSGVRLWSWNTRARCSARARDSFSRVAESTGCDKSIPEISAPIAGVSGVIVISGMASSRSQELRFAIVPRRLGGKKRVGRDVVTGGIRVYIACSDGLPQIGSCRDFARPAEAVSRGAYERARDRCDLFRRV